MHDEKSNKILSAEANNWSAAVLNIDWLASTVP